MPAEQFTGQARDEEAGRDYFHARMHQPRSGRFNAVDPVHTGVFDRQQWNRYACARNSFGRHATQISHAFRASVQFADEDDVQVIASLNTGDSGVPFELDVGKTDSSPLRLIPNDFKRIED